MKLVFVCMSPTPRRRIVAPKSAARMRRADRKRQLLELAKQLFVTLGYHNTTTDKIAKAAGVSEPVLYRHFENKKALFLEVLDEVRQATVLRWKAETAKLADPVAKLQAVIDIFLGATREHPLELRVMHRTLVEADDEEIAASLRSFYLESETLLAHIIAEGQRKGIFSTSFDSRVAAWEFIRSAMAFVLTQPLDIPLYREPEYIQRAVEYLFRALVRT